MRWSQLVKMFRAVDVLCGFLLLNAVIQNGESQLCSTERKTNPNRFSYSLRETVCTGILSKFPKEDYSSTLRCINCTLNIINNATFENFHGNNIDLSKSHVKLIDENAFVSQEDLVFIDLSYNELTDINTKSLKKLKDLKLLRLDNNKFKDLPAHAFDGITIRSLNLSYNFLKEIQSETFKGAKVCSYSTWMSNCEFIFSYNQISKIHQNAFRADGAFSVLDLSNNALTEIEKSSFFNVTMVKLDLSKNAIGNLDPQALNGIINLIKLNLGFNQISTIPNAFFSGIPKLTELSLNNNRLTKINTTTFSGLPLLQFLDISNNRIKVIKETTLFPLSQLRNLDISFNRLQTLNVQNLLDNHLKLYKISVNHNFWLCKDLLDMYRMFNAKRVTMEAAGKDFHVPNLHGIPCSRSSFTISDDTDFDSFLRDLSHDIIDEDLYDIKPETIEDIEKISVSYIKGIYHMCITVTTIYLGWVLIKVITWIYMYLQQRNLAPKDFTILYNRT